MWGTVLHRLGLFWGRGGVQSKTKGEMAVAQFLFGQAKLVIYKTRKNRMENRRGQEITSLFKAFVKSRIVVEFKYYKAMKDMETF